MAAYDNLPVYKATYDLLLEVYKMSINLTREYRHTLGEKLKNELTDLLVTIYKANVDEGLKEPNLRKAREHVVVIKVYMRMLHDLGQIKLKRFVALNEKAENLSIQFANWHKSVINKQRNVQNV